MGHAELGWPTGQRGRGAGNAEQRAFGSRLVREGRGRVCLLGPGYQRPNKERRRGVSGACGSSWAGRCVRLGQRGTSVRAERGRESEGSLGRAGCEWSGGGLCRAGSLGHAREGEELGWVDGWLWAGFQVGLGFSIFLLFSNSNSYLNSTKTS